MDRARMTVADLDGGPDWPPLPSGPVAIRQRATKRRMGRRIGWVGGVSVFAIAGVIALQLSTGPGSSDVAIGGGSKALPDESLQDVVSYAAQTSVVTVVNEETLAPDQGVIDNGEGYVARTVTLRIDDTVWVFEPAQESGGELTLETFGWTMHDQKRLPIVTRSGLRLEVGRQYLATLALINCKWDVLLDASLPMTDGRTEPAKHATTEFTQVLQDMTPAEVGRVLASTPPNPLAIKYKTLDAAARYEAVTAEEAGATATITSATACPN